MNAFQKATFAASALAITLVGAALATAPMAFARPMLVAATGACQPCGMRLALSGRLAREAASRSAGLPALERR